MILFSWLFIKRNLIVIILFIILCTLRFVWIDKIPAGLQIDEVEYALSSKTFQMMGTDVSGVGFPASLVTTNTIGRVSPVPYMVLSPFWSVFELSLTSYRSLYVIINIIAAGTFLAILYTIFKNKHIAVIGGLLFLINPWSMFLSRHAIDGAFALLFYLLGSLFLLKQYSRKNIIVSLIFFILGCFSYHGAKLQLIPLVGAISIYKIFAEKIQGKKLLPYGYLIAFLSLTIATFFIGGIILKDSILSSRSHELVFTNMNTFSKDVDTVRTTSIESPLTQIMINKFGFTLQYVLDNYFKAFDFTLLFLKAEIIGIHGFFYFFEVVFLIIGVITLAQKNRQLFYLIAVITLLAPISTVTSLSGFSILNRGILLLPMLLVFISYGVYRSILWSNRFIPMNIYSYVLTSIYAISFLFFLYSYFYIIPVQNFMHYETTTRILEKYLGMEKKLKQTIIVVNSKPNTIFRGMLFYQPKEKQETILKQKQTFSDTTNYSFDNIRITDDCIEQFDPKITYFIHKDSLSCFKEIPADMYIINEKDAGIDYFIVNSSACRQFRLSRWHAPHLFSDFNINGMSEEQFCTRWIAADENLLKSK